MGELQTYRIYFPTAAGPWDFPVKGYKGRVRTRKRIYVKFLHRHVRDTMVILDEGTPPHTDGNPL